jgi:glucan 1,3-beta-glucosidase
LRERKGKERYPETRDEAKGTRSGGEELDREQRRSARRKERESKHASAGSANSATQLLSADALAKLDARNHKGDSAERARREKERRKKDRGGGLFAMKTRGRDTSPDRKKGAEKRRLVSGAILEEGRSPELRARGGYREKEKWRKGGGGGGGGDDDDGDGDGNGLLARWKRWSRKRKIFVVVGILAVLLIIIIAVAVVVSKRNGDSEAAGESVPEIKPPPNHELSGIDPNSIPVSTPCYLYLRWRQAY